MCDLDNNVRARGKPHARLVFCICAGFVPTLEPFSIPTVCITFGNSLYKEKYLSLSLYIYILLGLSTVDDCLRFRLCSYTCVRRTRWDPAAGAADTADTAARLAAVPRLCVND